MVTQFLVVTMALVSITIINIWTGSLTDVVEHMNYECQYSPVSLLLDENVEMPMIIMMRDFEQLKRNNERWY